MASTKTSLTNAQQKTDMVPEHEQPSFLQDFHTLVQQHAYALFERDGHEDGHALSHWLQAEDQFLIHPAIHEEAGTFTLKVSLPAKSADRVKVFSDENRAIISADAKREETLKNGTATSESASAYHSVLWPARVDPNTATAQFDDGILTLTARKAETVDGASTSATAAPNESAIANTQTDSNEKAKSAVAGPSGMTNASGVNPKV